MDKRGEMPLRHVVNKRKNDTIGINDMNDFILAVSAVNVDKTNTHFSVESTKTCTSVDSRSVSAAREHSSNRAATAFPLCLVCGVDSK